MSLHLLKLVTGVEISTRAVNRSGRPGNEVKSRSRKAAAAPKMAAFLLSILILNMAERKDEAQLLQGRGAHILKSVLVFLKESRRVRRS